MESLCSPSPGSTCPRCGDPTGEGEAAGASSTAGNDSEIIWVLIGMQELLRIHSEFNPLNIRIWVSTGQAGPLQGGSAPSLWEWRPGCTAWPQSSQCPRGGQEQSVGAVPGWEQLPAAAAWPRARPAPGSSLGQPLAAEVP